MIPALFLLLLQAADPTVPTAQSAHVAEGRGVQIYTCTQSQWALTAPEAKLYEKDKQVGTHSAGPTWTWSDGSSVTGTVLQKLPSATSIPWLLLTARPAGNATGALSHVTYVRRSDTRGGLAPATPCTEGQTTRVPYSATYTFYTGTQ